jgi:hypothetical protein
MDGEVHMTGELMIENPVEGPNGEISGLLLSWYSGFGWGTLCSRPQNSANHAGAN